MKHTLVNKLIVTLAVVACVSLLATSALAGGSDAFNRKMLGTRWHAVDGSVTITDDHFAGTSEALAYFSASNEDTAATAVVELGGTDLEYGAIALGDIASGNNAFVKIQAQNGDGTFDHAAFYSGDNGGGTFFELNSTVPSPAVLDVFFCGTTAVMKITSAAGVQEYTNDYGTTFPAGAGLGTYGSVGLDNYVGFPSACHDGLQHAVAASSMPQAVDLSKK
jgi:hypothetical protein